MQIVKALPAVIVLSVLFPVLSLGQGKWKAGVGLNFISNNFDVQYLDSYLAPSFHAGYTIFRKSRVSLDLETGNSIKLKQDDKGSQVGFTSSLPLIFSWEIRKFTVQAGAGPAFLHQQSKVYFNKASVTGAYMNYTGGLSFKGRPFLADILLPEYNFRMTYFRSFKTQQLDAGMISLIVFFRSM